MLCSIIETHHPPITSVFCCLLCFSVTETEPTATIKSCHVWGCWQEHPDLPSNAAASLWGFYSGPQTTESFSTLEKKSFSLPERHARMGRRRYTCDRISCQLTLEHTADIYSFLETTVSSRRTIRQASKVNNMLTTISRPHANQVCQSHESCLLLWFRCGWKQASQRMVRQPRRAHEQQIEQFTTQDNGESLGNTKKTQQMLN